MCCKRYHIIFSTFPLNFKCKICVLKDVIPNFKNHIWVTWPAMNLLSLRKWCGFNIWPTNRFSKAKSHNFHFHKNDVTWPLSANGLLISEVTYGFISGTSSLFIMNKYWVIWWATARYDNKIDYCLKINVHATGARFSHNYRHLSISTGNHWWWLSNPCLYKFLLWYLFS